MSDSRLKQIAIPAALVLVLAIGGGTLYLVAKSPSPTPISSPPSFGTMVAGNAVAGGAASSTQPKITWSQQRVEIILASGQSFTKDILFTSNLELQNVIIEAVPEIASFIAIQPNTFTSVPARRPQLTRVTFSIPLQTASGTFEGTIHVRVINQTLPQTLKVLVNVWRGVQLDSGHVTVAVPPSWSFQAATGQIDASTPSLQNLASRQDAEVPPADLVVRIFPNPSALPVDQFSAQFDQGWFQAYLTKSIAIVDGHNAIIFSDRDSATPHQPLYAALVDDPEHKQVVVVTMLEVTRTNIGATFQQVVSGIRFK